MRGVWGTGSSNGETDTSERRTQKLRSVAGDGNRKDTSSLSRGMEGNKGGEEDREGAESVDRQGLGHAKSVGGRRRIVDSEDEDEGE